MNDQYHFLLLLLLSSSTIITTLIFVATIIFTKLQQTRAFLPMDLRPFPIASLGLPPPLQQ